MMQINNEKESVKKRWTKNIAAILVAAMILSVVPSNAVPAVAATMKKVVKTIVEPKLVYEDVYGFFNNVSPVENKKGKHGVINKSGKVVVKCSYDSLKFTDDNKNFIAKDSKSKWYLLNLKGKKVKSFGKYSYLYEVSQKYFKGSDGNGKYTLLKRDGTKVLSGKFSDMYFVNKSKNLLVKDETGTYSLYNLSGKKISTYGTYSSMYEVKTGYLQCNNYDTSTVGITKIDGTVVFAEGQFKSIGIIGDKWLVSDAESCWYIYNNSGNMVKKLGNYVSAYQSYNTGNIIVYTGTYYGMLKSDGTEIMKANKYTRYSFVFNTTNMLVADSNSKWYIINKSGKKLKTIGKYDYCSYLASDLYYVGNNKTTSTSVVTKYGVVNSSGKVIIAVGKYESFEYISKLKSMLVHDKNNKYYLVNNKGKKKVSYGKHNYMYESDGMLYAQESEGKYSLYSYNGKNLFGKGKVTDKGVLNKTYMPVEIKGKWGIYRIK